jgi:predicted dehydrogenase
LIGEKLSHYLDLQRWFLGGSVAEVYSLSAPNAVKYFNHSDNHQISLRFDGGKVASLNFIMHLAESDRGDPLVNLLDKQADDGHCLQTHIFGTNGAIETDVFRRRIRLWAFTDGPRQLESAIVETIEFPQEEDQVWFHNVHGQILQVIEQVANGLPPENSANDAYETMKLVFAAEKSEQEGKAINLSE